MKKMAAVWATLIALQGLAVCAAESTESDPSSTSSSSDTKEQSEKTPTGYPPFTEKQLYAEHDLRGKPAPKLVVSEWLTGAAPDTKGKVVLLDFWATWCGPCRDLIPELNQYKKKFGNDLAIIGISGEADTEVLKFMKGTPIDYDVAVAPDRGMYKTIGIKGIPHCLVISADGIVRWQGFPPMHADPLTEEKLAQIIKESKTQQAKSTSSDP